MDYEQNKRQKAYMKASLILIYEVNNTLKDLDMEKDNFKDLAWKIEEIQVLSDLINNRNIGWCFKND